MQNILTEMNKTMTKINYETDLCSRMHKILWERQRNCRGPLSYIHIRDILLNAAFGPHSGNVGDVLEE